MKDSDSATDKPVWLTPSVHRKVLDVRPILTSGQDPLQQILSTVNELDPGQVLQIISGFKPSPLIKLMGTKGALTHCEAQDDGLYYTYFLPSGMASMDQAPANGSWDTLLAQFEGRITELDVKDLSPPQPMIRILKQLEHWNSDRLLLVRHDRIPSFLFPELEEGGFAFQMEEVAPDRYDIAIYLSAK